MNLDYPRPLLRRDDYLLLDGEWTLNGHSIRVPFPPQAKASGYEGEIGDVLVYETTFHVPTDWTGNRILLHFGAADARTSVYINGTYAGRHDGGYLPFTLDITEKLSHSNTLRVECEDTLSHSMPYGKQHKKPHGMWYTPVSGIWQSVWIEPVAQTYVTRLESVPDQNGVNLRLFFNRPHHPQGFMARLTWDEEHEGIQTPWQNFSTDHAYFNVSHALAACGVPSAPESWSPDHPKLYYLEIKTGGEHFVTYFGLRVISEEIRSGRPLLTLNGDPVFLHAVLDQGYYGSGLYLPEHNEQYAQDIEKIKALGFNTLRKHLKVEPEVFYYACDRLGIMVIQDMVNSGPYSWFFDTFLPNLGLRFRPDTWLPQADRQRKNFWLQTMTDTIAHLSGHPSIVVWTLFNEGWGQFEADKAYRIAKAADSTRPVDTTSGWFAQKKSDFDSRHCYFFNRSLHPGVRPMLLSECGGYSRKIQDHTPMKKTLGYGNCRDEEELNDRILDLYETMVLPAIPDGLCGCVYTQSFDVENEINGLYTEDREICKADVRRMQNIADRIGRTLETAPFDRAGKKEETP